MTLASWWLKYFYLFIYYFHSHEKAKEAVIYSYNKHINGFAALLEEEEASEIESELINDYHGFF